MIRGLAAIFALAVCLVAGQAQASLNTSSPASCASLYPADATACLQASIDASFDTTALTSKTQIDCMAGDYNFTDVVIYPGTYINFEPGCHWHKTANGPGLHTSSCPVTVSCPGLNTNGKALGEITGITLIRPWIDGGGYTGPALMLENVTNSYILQPNIQNFADGNWTFSDYSGNPCALHSNTYAGGGIILKGTVGDGSTPAGCGSAVARNSIFGGSVRSNYGGTPTGTGVRLMTTAGQSVGVANFNGFYNMDLRYNTTGVMIEYGGDNWFTQDDVSYDGWGFKIGTTGGSRYATGTHLSDPYIENDSSGGIWLTDHAQATVIDTLASASGTTITVKDDDAAPPNSINGNQVWLHRTGLAFTMQGAPVATVPQTTFGVDPNGNISPASAFYTTMAWGPMTAIPGAGVYSGFQVFAAPTQGSAASTVLSLTASSSSFACTVNPSVKVYDCGSSATCAGPTAVNGTALTVTQANKAFWTATLSHAAIPRGNYVAAEWTGTCTAFNPMLSIAASNQ